jgi:hypothetical protein
MPFCGGYLVAFGSIITLSNVNVISMSMCRNYLLMRTARSKEHQSTRAILRCVYSEVSIRASAQQQGTYRVQRFGNGQILLPRASSPSGNSDPWNYNEIMEQHISFYFRFHIPCVLSKLFGTILNFKIMWHVNPLLGNTHTANNTAAVVSLCLRNLCMRGDVTQQKVANTWHMFSVGTASAPMDWLRSNRVTYIFSVWSVPRNYLEDIRHYKAVGSWEFSSVRKAVKKRFRFSETVIVTVL